MIHVDRRNCKHVWHALRGGWAFPVYKDGTVGTEPKKNRHSHPGDAVGYGASILYPLSKINKERKDGVNTKNTKHAKHTFGKAKLGFEKPGLKLPRHGDRIKGL